MKRQRGRVAVRSRKTREKHVVAEQLRTYINETYGIRLQRDELQYLASQMEEPV